jgi:hypothetical protein
MKSAQDGISTSGVEVTNISGKGIWLLIHDVEVFLSFVDFPWFEEAPVKKILHVEMPSEDHLYWPDLDVDLHLESIFHPESYPLVSRQMP